MQLTGLLNLPDKMLEYLRHKAFQTQLMDNAVKGFLCIINKSCSFLNILFSWNNFLITIPQWAALKIRLFWNLIL